MKPSDFKVGDRVIIQNCFGWDGLTGTVNTSTGTYVEVTMSDGINANKGYYFYPNQLSPQSPQPQTTQQKEDTVKPYAVIYLSLSAQQNASINGFYATEAEAKEAAEQLVANQRANLTTKQYFAVTIVNTKTGKLIGSVVDAPPAVEWATS